MAQLSATVLRPARPRQRPSTLLGVINAGQLGAVGAAFKLAGYEGPLLVAPVTSEDERFFLMDAEALEALRDVRALEQVLQQLLGRKVAVVRRDDRWGQPTPFVG